MQDTTLQRSAPRLSRPHDSSARASTIAFVAVPALAALLLYARTVRFALVFDDLSLIGAQGPEWLGGTWLPYRPLRHLSYFFDHALLGGSDAAYHGVNVALHGATASLVSLIARRLGIGAVAASVGGIVFAVHPLCVEAAAYVSGRRDLLATALTLSALWLWLGPPRRGRVGLALAAALAACAAKESGVLAFGLLALASAVGLGPRIRDASLPLASWLTGAVVLMALYGATGPWLPSGNAGEWVGVAGALCTHYLGHLLAPMDLAIAYPHLLCRAESCTVGTLAGSTVGAVVLLVLTGVSAVSVLRASDSSLRSGVRAAFCLGSFTLILGALALFIGRHEPGADRHAYPLVALFALLVADVGERVLRSRESRAVTSERAVGNEGSSSGAGAKGLAAVVFALVSSAILIVGSAWLSDRRIAVWRDETTLWTRTVAQQPRSARAHYNLAAVLWEDGERSKTRSLLRRAARLDPGHVQTHLARAAVECEAGRSLRARRFLDVALDAGADWRRVRSVELVCPAQMRSERAVSQTHAEAVVSAAGVGATP